MIEEIFQPISENHFPGVNPNLIRVWKLKDGTIRQGKYRFNSTCARRWIDDGGNEYTSDMVAGYYDLVR